MDHPTPMLQQYKSIKAQHKDCILFFRLGDFYEMFFEDAQKASRILDVVLTSRGHSAGHKVPMCGIPFHAADAYIAKLIKAGEKIAICEQTEDPALAKGIVKREVVRVITSGTYIDENQPQSRYILCLNPSLSGQRQGIGVAFTDVTQGTIQTNEYADRTRTVELMSKLPIYECLFPINHEKFVKELLNHPLLKLRHITLSPHEDWCFNSDIARKSLCEHLQTHSLKGFGVDELSLAVGSAGALLEYLKQMNRQPLKHIDRISLYADCDYVFISPAAHHGLELESLIKTLDRTHTALGKRQLRQWVHHPLKNIPAIVQRQNAVGLLKEHRDLQQDLGRLLKFIPDIEKSLSRLSCGYSSPKDILALRNALDRLPQIQQAISPLNGQSPFFTIDDIPDLRRLLIRAINPDMPLANAEGKIINKGYDDELDSLREVQDNGRQWLRSFQEREIKRTKINSLKVGFNQVFGYYIEITKANLHSTPPDYIRKQTLVNAERFITPELKEFEEKILTADDKVLKIENRIVAEIQRQILEASPSVHIYSSQIAALDVLYSFSLLAMQPGYIAPALTNNSLIDIKDGRHPVVEESLSETFIANDTFLNCEDHRLIIITGPNMAGKSTYIRQVAILTIMAQIGSFLPAKSATIGVVDKIFTRIGAQDQITKGQSTFMVEMSETAEILNNLSPGSLVILDEIGRGTSTFDGLSLAWALAEHLQKHKARTLFATHFHELTALAEEFDGIKNYNVAVKEWREEIVFLHKIVPGSTDDSYGIYVAKLAGIPREVINRSKQILAQLEIHGNLKDKIRQRAGNTNTQVQLPLFSQPDDPVINKIKSVIKDMDINTLTPIKALNTLQEFKELLGDEHTQEKS